MKKELFFLALIGLLALLVLLPLSPIRQKITTEDSGMYLYVGREILTGKVLYRDLWDNKGPVLYYLNALGLFLGRDSRWGVWWLEWFFIFSAAALGYFLIKQILGFLPAVFATVSWVMSLIFLLNGGNLPEEYALPFQFLSLYFFWLSGKEKRSFWLKFFIGFFGGLAFFLKQNLIGVQISIGICLFLKAIFQGDWRRTFKDLGTIFLGFALMSLTVFACFQANNAWDDLIEAYFRFNLSYSSVSLFDRFKAIFMGFWLLARSGIFFVVLASWLTTAWLYLKGKRFFRGQERLMMLALFLISFPVELLLVSLSGKKSPQYYLAWLPMATFWLGFFVRFLLIKNRVATKFFLFFLLLAMVIPPVGVWAYEMMPPSSFDCQGVGWFLFPSAYYFECSNTKQKVAEYILATTNQDDYVLIWGFGPSLNFSTHRSSPTRFPQQMHQLHDYGSGPVGYQRDKLLKEFLADIKENPPVLIVDSAPPFYYFPPLDPSERKEKWQGKLLPEVEKIFAYLESNYELVERIGKDQWAVYEIIKN